MNRVSISAENGRRYGRVVPNSQCTAIAVIINEEAEFAALARQSEQNRKARLTAERRERHLQYLKQETKRFNRRRQVQKAVDRLVTVSLVAASVVCFHLLPWWSCVAPVVGAAWLKWRAKCKG